MTGFGVAEAELSGRLSAQVTIRSVNHRYRDIQLRFLGRDEGPELESRLRRQVEHFVQRGRVSVQVELRWLQAPPTQVLLDRAAVEGLVDELSPIGELRLGEILGIPGLVTVSSSSDALSEEEMDVLDSLIQKAGTEFRQRREGEAQGLLLQIRQELEHLSHFVQWIEVRLPEFRKRILLRLRERLEELVQNVTVDEARLVQEGALLADRADVAEEVIRLKTHLRHFVERLDSGGTVGRALDFLCQELQREVNTLGTKCRELGVAERIVDAKGAIERIREQIQNLE